jgi:nitrate/nitrite transport system ATP-binding protein
VVPLTAAPRATLGPSIPVTVARPRARTAINHDPTFKETRIKVIDYLLKSAERQKVAVTKKLLLPDLLPEDLSEPRRPFGQKRRPRRRSEEKRETVEVVSV